MTNTVIKNLRTERHISQRELAAAVGLTQQAVAKWEKGISEPDSGTLLKLADYFGVTVDYLLGRSDTGTQKEKPTVKDDELSDEEQELINLYRAATPEMRKIANRILKDE